MHTCSKGVALRSADEGDAAYTFMLTDAVSAGVETTHSSSKASTVLPRTRVIDYNRTTTSVVVRDTTGDFQCGGTAADPVTCGMATVHRVGVGVDLAFVLLARHGTFELYLEDDNETGSEMMLVQTSTYGRYPVRAASVGFVVEGVVQARWSDLQAWEMSRGLSPGPA